MTVCAGPGCETPEPPRVCRLGVCSRAQYAGEKKTNTSIEIFAIDLSFALFCFVRCVKILSIDSTLYSIDNHNDIWVN